MTTAGVPTGYFNQTYCVEFTVEGPLDGTTLSPPILDSPPTGANEGDPQGLFRRTVESLGLIDADYLVPVNEDDRRGSRGNRLITFLWIEGSSPGAIGASVDVVDAVDGGGGSVQKNIGDLGGVTTFFREGIFLPQGSMLRIGGMSGSAGEPIKVRLHIQFVNGARDLAAVLAAICCIEGQDGAFNLEVQDESALVALTQILNFTGAGVQATADPPNNRVNVEIPGGAAVGGNWFQEAIWVDAGTTVPVPQQDGTMGRPFSTLTASIAAAVAKQNALPIGKLPGERAGTRQVFMVAGGIYDEDMLMTRGDTFYEFLAMGPVTLGNGLGVNFSSTNTRNVRWVNTQVQEDADSGLASDNRRPQLLLGTLQDYGPTSSTHTAAAVGWSISGDIILENPDGSGFATTAEFHLTRVKVFGGVDFSGAISGVTDFGVRNIYMRYCFVEDPFVTVTRDGAGNVTNVGGGFLQVAQYCEWDSVVDINVYGHLSDCEFEGMIASSSGGALPPVGFLHCDFDDDFESAPVGAVNMIMDCVTNGYFVANAATLSGGAAKVIIDDCNAGPFALPVVAGLVLHLDAADTSTVTLVGSDVSVWADKSTEGNDFVQAVVANRPLYFLDAFNGLPVVRFDGVNDFLERLGFTGLVSEPGATVFCLFRRLEDPSTNAVMVQAFTAAATSFPRVQFAQPIAGTKVFHTGAFSNSIGFSRDFIVEPGIPYIFSSRFDGTLVGAARLALWIDGITGDPLDYGAAPLPSADTGVVTSMRLGTTSVPGFEINGDLAELLVFDRALTNPERLQVERYLRMKWLP